MSLRYVRQKKREENTPSPTRLWSQKCSAYCTQLWGDRGSEKDSAKMLECLLPFGTAQSRVQGVKGVSEHRQPLILC